MPIPDVRNRDLSERFQNPYPGRRSQAEEFQIPNAIPIAIPNARDVDEPEGVRNPYASNWDQAEGTQVPEVIPSTSNWNQPDEAQSPYQTDENRDEEEEKPKSPWHSTSSPRVRSTNTRFSLPGHTRRTPSPKRPLFRPKNTGFSNAETIKQASPPSPDVTLRYPVHLQTTDNSYRSGYEANSYTTVLNPRGNNNLSAYPETALSGSSLQPLRNPTIPRLDRPTVPRIATTFSGVEPLRIQHSSETEQATFSDNESVYSTDGSEELTDILEVYLQEVVGIAAARGDISPGLGEFVRNTPARNQAEDYSSHPHTHNQTEEYHDYPSAHNQREEQYSYPPADDQTEEHHSYTPFPSEIDDAYEDMEEPEMTAPGGNGTGFVSMVRRALRHC